jgi:hypothetical protein
MNSFETIQIITHSLTRNGTFCESEGISIIVALWEKQYEEYLKPSQS